MLLDYTDDDDADLNFAENGSGSDPISVNDIHTLAGVKRSAETGIGNGEENEPVIGEVDNTSEKENPTKKARFD